MKEYRKGQEILIREKYGKNENIKKAVIESIGDRYIYIDIEDGRYLKMSKPFADRPWASGRTEMFLSEDDMIEYDKYAEDLKVIKKYFMIKKPITYDQARKIKEILEG